MNWSTEKHIYKPIQVPAYNIHITKCHNKSASDICIVNVHTTLLYGSKPKRRGCVVLLRSLRKIINWDDVMPIKKRKIFSLCYKLGKCTFLCYSSSIIVLNIHQLHSHILSMVIHMYIHLSTLSYGHRMRDRFFM